MKYFEWRYRYLLYRKKISWMKYSIFIDSLWNGFLNFSDIHTFRIFSNFPNQVSSKNNVFFSRNSTLTNFIGTRAAFLVVLYHSDFTWLGKLRHRHEYSFNALNNFGKTLKQSCIFSEKSFVPFKVHSIHSLKTLLKSHNTQYLIR